MEKTTDVAKLFDQKTLAVLVENGAGDEIIDAGDLGKFYKYDKIYRPGDSQGVVSLAIRLDQAGKHGMWFIPGVGNGNFNGDGTLTENDILD